MKHFVLFILLISLTCTSAQAESIQLKSDKTIEVDITGGNHREEINPFDFPFDHGPHNDVTMEWWYFTGEVITNQNKRLGYFFVIYKWREDEKDFFFTAEAAVSDIEASQFHFDHLVNRNFEEYSHEGIPEIRAKDFSYSYSEGGGFRININSPKITFDITAEPTLPALSHDDDGVLLRAFGEGSHYYSHTNIDTTGTIIFDQQEYKIVSGRSWMDHQWGNFTIGDKRWDWFSLRFDNGGALMIYNIRDGDGNIIVEKWTYRSKEGIIMVGEGFTIESQQSYYEEHANVDYPIGWNVTIPGLNSEFSINAIFDSQALHGSSAFWEGICDVKGSIDGDQANGTAYVELSGYEH